MVDSSSSHKCICECILFRLTEWGSVSIPDTSLTALQGRERVAAYRAVISRLPITELIIAALGNNGPTEHCNVLERLK